MNNILDAAPIIGLLFFFLVFCFIVWRAYRPSVKTTLQKDAMIPLREDTNERA